ncbi:MAG: hypothetical protein V3573_06630 [Desulfovibrionaceae bacterium]
MLNCIFWMVMGALQVLVVMGLVEWFKSRGRKAVWWQVGLFYLGFVSLGGVVAGGATLMGEYESIAGWYFIGVLGIPVVICLAIAVRLFIMRKDADVSRSS